MSSPVRILFQSNRQTMAARITSEDSDDEFQGIQVNKLQNNYRHAREDQREFTIEKKDQLRMQRFDC